APRPTAVSILVIDLLIIRACPALPQETTRIRGRAIQRSEKREASLPEPWNRSQARTTLDIRASPPSVLARSPLPHRRVHPRTRPHPPGQRHPAGRADDHRVHHRWADRPSRSVGPVVARARGARHRHRRGGRNVGPPHGRRPVVAGWEVTWRSRLFDRLQYTSVAIHDSWESGQLLSRAVNDLSMLRRFFAFGLPFLLSTPIVLAVGSIILVLMQPVFGLIMIIMAVPAI